MEVRVTECKYFAPKEAVSYSSLIHKSFGGTDSSIELNDLAAPYVDVPPLLYMHTAEIMLTK